MFRFIFPILQGIIDLTELSDVKYTTDAGKKWIRENGGKYPNKEQLKKLLDEK